MLKQSCRRGHSMQEHGRYVQVGNQRLSMRCTLCEQATREAGREKDREQKRQARQKRCRHGHDLSVHGKMVESPSRSLHMKCMECRRLAREREHLRNRVKRRIASSQRPLPQDKTECVNGHSRAEHWRHQDNDAGYCRECRRVRDRKRSMR